MNGSPGEGGPALAINDAVILSLYPDNITLTVQWSDPVGCSCRLTQRTRFMLEIQRMINIFIKMRALPVSMLLNVIFLLLFFLVNDRKLATIQS